MSRLAAPAAASLLALGSPAGAIVGATTETPGLVDHLVMVLQHQGRTAGFCTGIVVAPTVVMTAAHCVPPGADLRVHYPDPGHDPVLLLVRAVERHPAYRADAIRTRERSIDLALVRLAAPLPARFSPAPLGAVTSTVAGTSFTVAGYGVTLEGDPASSGRLTAARLEARPPLSDVLLWLGATRGGTGGACTGDSGGPVLSEDGAVMALTLWASGRAGRHCGDLTQALWLYPLSGWVDGIVTGWDAKP